MKKEKMFINKVAWITGASSGIGESLVYEFVKRGATVVVSSNDPSGLERVKAACADKSAMVHCVPFDLADTSEINNIVDKQINITGKVDFLLNIGGISQRARIDETQLPCAFVPPVRWRRYRSILRGRKQNLPELFELQIGFCSSVPLAERRRGESSLRFARKRSTGPGISPIPRQIGCATSGEVGFKPKGIGFWLWARSDPVGAAGGARPAGGSLRPVLLQRSFRVS